MNLDVRCPYCDSPVDNAHRLPVIRKVTVLPEHRRCCAVCRRRIKLVKGKDDIGEVWFFQARKGV